MKKRSFLFLGLSAFLVGGLILGCALFSESETADDLEARVQSGAPDKEGNVLVKIQIPDLTDARTLNAPVAPNLIDYYEIIFKMHGQSVYYKGTAAEGEVLVVSVKPGQKYDILLLAGDKQYKTLIASAFANMLTPLTTDGDFDPTGIGIEIKANAANVINLKPTAVKIDPETDYTITAGSDIFSPSVVRDSLVSGTDYAGIPRFTVAENNNHADSTGTHKLTVAVKTNGLLPLIQAGIAGEFTLTKAEMSLKPYSKSHPFNTQFKAISPTEIDGTPPTLTLPSSVTSGAGVGDEYKGDSRRDAAGWQRGGGHHNRGDRAMDGDARMVAGVDWRAF
jgi:hypothetical protein